MAHGIMGAVMAMHPFDAKLAFMARAGAILLVVHMFLAVFITMNKNSDPTPPSKSKHALQWITGTVILVLALFHMDFIGSAGSGASFIELPNFVSLAVMVGIMIALIAYIAINLKSMFADMGMTGPEMAESGSSRRRGIPRSDRAPQLAAGRITSPMPQFLTHAIFPQGELAKTL